MYNISIIPAEKAGQNQHLLLGTDVPRHYWEVRCQKDGWAQWSVYLATNQSEILPQYYLPKDGRLVFVGAEQGIFSLKLEDGTVVDKITDATYVHEFTSTTTGTILVTAEDQLVAFAPTGVFLWRQNFPERIDGLTDADPVLVVEDAEGEKYFLDAVTGHPVKA